MSFIFAVCTNVCLIYDTIHEICFERQIYHIILVIEFISSFDCFKLIFLPKLD